MTVRELVELLLKVEDQNAEVKYSGEDGYYEVNRVFESYNGVVIID